MFEALKLSPVEAAMLKAVTQMKTPASSTADKTPVYNLTLKQIEDMKRNAVNEAVETAWTLMLGLPIMALTDKHDFTSDDVDKLVDNIIDLHDSYEKGYLTLSDIHTALREEHGLTIVGKVKNRRKYK